MRKTYRGKYTQNYLMTLVEDVPQSFYSWAKKQFAFDNRILVNKENDKLIAQCMQCGGTYEVQKVNHNKKTVCPLCKAKATFKNGKFAKSYREEIQEYFIYVQKTEIGLIQRYFKCFKRNSWHKDAIKYGFYELERAFFTGSGDSKNYNVFQKRQYCDKNGKWCKGQFRSNGFRYFGVNWVYPNNLQKVVDGDLKWKYSQLKKYCKNKRCNPIEYLSEYSWHPQIEYLVKAGLTNIVIRNGNVLDFSKKNLKGLLKLKEDTHLKLFKKYNLGERSLKRMHECERERILLNDKSLRFLLCQDYVQIKALNKLVPLNVIGNYYFTLSDKERKATFATDYYDYIRACKKLKMNLSDTQIIKPKNFKVMHDRVLGQYKIQESEIAVEEFKKAVKNRKYLEYKDKRYEIRLPNDVAELLAEGRTLGHCVGGYAERVSEGETNILFIRKIREPDVPFYTLEVNCECKIIQCRTKGNKGYSSDLQIVNLLEKYKQKVLEKYKTKMQEAV